jgi:type VI protein secretion system component VasA
MNEDETEMAEAYALLRGFELTGQLGTGLNGRVWKVRDNRKRAWALKIQDAQGFKLERACYERLAELEVTEVAGFNVPVLIHAEERWRAIEMSSPAKADGGVRAPFRRSHFRRICRDSWQ